MALKHPNAAGNLTSSNNNKKKDIHGTKNATNAAGNLTLSQEQQQQFSSFVDLRWSCR